MIKDFATIDFETYYDKEYSLSKMQLDEYVYDKRFEIIGVGAKSSQAEEIEWFSGNLRDTRDFLRSKIDWANTPVLAHHTHFDGFISTQKLGLKPKLWLDTLSMARASYPWLKSYSLAALAEFFHIGQKGVEVQNAIGLRREDFTIQQLAKYGEYCANDVALTAVIGALLLEWFPLLETTNIDMCIRMFTEPKLYGDAYKLMEYYTAEVERKDKLLATAGISKDDLMSNNKLADILVKYNVSPPTKTSARTGKQAFAFAKSDKEFIALLEHPDPQVQAIIAARLGVKTTIAETRALRFLNSAARGPLPVYLNYWGARTTGRFSGGNQMNWQNIPARGPGAELRKAIVAPEGYSVVVGDSSNIELRVAMAAAGDTKTLAKLASGVDLYCDFASKIFGRVITKADKSERMLGKIAMLSLQYGAGPEKFREMVRFQAGIDLSLKGAENIVNLYRTVHNKIQRLWWYCGSDVLKAIYRVNLLTPVDVNGWCLTTENGFSQPGTPGVCYHELKELPDGSWEYESGRAKVYIYGGKVVENLCQYLARNIVIWQTARINQRYPVVLSVHDEVVCVVPDNEVEACKLYMEESLSLAPQWCRGQIPLACEVGVGKSYGDAK